MLNPIEFRASDSRLNYTSPKPKKLVILYKANSYHWPGVASSVHGHNPFARSQEVELARPPCSETVGIRILLPPNAQRVKRSGGFATPMAIPMARDGRAARPRASATNKLATSGRKKKAKTAMGSNNKPSPPAFRAPYLSAAWLSMADKSLLFSRVRRMPKFSVSVNGRFTSDAAKLNSRFSSTYESTRLFAKVPIKVASSTTSCVEKPESP
mmetsp:Transcript_63161/g.163969  ORF Transcript_63161/g.163969 Transcript_63161/m.163969 type:complete len:212 (+) Transcript_63161:60-695(+)